MEVKEVIEIIGMDPIKDIKDKDNKETTMGIRIIIWVTETSKGNTKTIITIKVKVFKINTIVKETSDPRINGTKAEISSNLSNLSFNHITKTETNKDSTKTKALVIREEAISTIEEILIKALTTIMIIKEDLITKEDITIKDSRITTI